MSDCTLAWYDVGIPISTSLSLYIYLCIYLSLSLSIYIYMCLCVSTVHPEASTWFTSEPLSIRKRATKKWPLLDDCMLHKTQSATRRPQGGIMYQRVSQWGGYGGVVGLTLSKGVRPSRGSCGSTDTPRFFSTMTHECHSTGARYIPHDHA